MVVHVIQRMIHFLGVIISFAIVQMGIDD
jgi:hypothetical protein